jgi:valyl-tRNA synthetase
MVMMTEYVMETKPFDQVYLHGLIRDEHGKKMSKSAGNGIDPIPMIEKFGTDAVRLSLIIGATPGNDLSLSETKIGGYRNFVNKLWNISRFILTSVDDVRLVAEAPEGKTMADRWILQRLHQTIETVTTMIEKKQFSLAAENLYSFTWSELADWYLEIAKVLNRTNPAEKKMRDDVILYVLQNLLKLWHPFTPFVTEVIWKQFETGRFLMLDRWPEKKEIRDENEESEEMKRLQEIITTLRNARSEHKIQPAVITNVKHVGQHEEQIEQWKNIIETLARVKFVTALESKLELKGTWFRLLTDIAAPQEEVNHEEILKYIRTLEDKLANKEFVERAPAQVIAETNKKLAEAKSKLA